MILILKYGIKSKEVQVSIFLITKVNWYSRMYKSTDASRSLSVDYLKSAAIFGVVYIHVGGFYSEVFRFGVPIFIYIFSYLFELKIINLKNKNSDISAYIYQRFKKLFIPYLFWSLIYLILFHANSIRSIPPSTIINGFLGGYGWSGQYFFIILFQLILLFSNLSRLANKKSTTISLIMVSIFFDLAVFYTFFSLDKINLNNGPERLFLWWLPYLFLGIASARNYIGHYNALFPIAIITLLLGPTEHMILGKYYGYLSASVILGSVLLILAVGPDPSIIYRPNILKLPNHLNQLIEYIGKNTFIIFVCNPLVIYLIDKLNLHLESESLYGFLQRFLLSLYVMVGCLFIGEFLS